MIDTGDDRNIVGHFVSGAVFSALFSGAMNYNKYKKNEMSKSEMLKDTGTLSLQGGVGTASAIATANYVGRGNYVAALTAASLGAMGIYGIQRASEAFYGDNGRPKVAEKEVTEEEKESKEVLKASSKKVGTRKKTAVEK